MQKAIQTDRNCPEKGGAFIPKKTREKGGGEISERRVEGILLEEGGGKEGTREVRSPLLAHAWEALTSLETTKRFRGEEVEGRSKRK